GGGSPHRYGYRREAPGQVRRRNRRWSPRTGSPAPGHRTSRRSRRRRCRSAEARELSADPPMVLGEELAPRAVAELSGLRRRPHDVGEEHRGEYPVGLDSVPFAPFPDAREEAFHVLGDLLGALGEPGVTITGQDDQSSARDGPLSAGTWRSFPRRGLRPFAPGKWRRTVPPSVRPPRRP